MIQFKEIPLEEFYHLTGFGPCVMVTSGTFDSPNVAPIAWHTPVNDDPPMLALAVAELHHTAKLIRETKEFVVNIPDQKMLPAIMVCGKLSGKKENKFKRTLLQKKEGIKVKTPHLSDSVAFIECRMVDAHPYEGVLLIVADVVSVHVREDLYDGYFIPEKAQTLHHMGGEFFALTGKRFRPQ